MKDISFLFNETATEIRSNEVLNQLIWLNKECQDRCLIDTEKWCNEILANVPHQWLINPEINIPVEPSPQEFLQNRKINLSKTLILTREFARASFFLSQVKNDSFVTKFLYYYSRFLLCTKMNLENETEAIDHRVTNSGFEIKDDDDMAELLRDMYSDNGNNEFDAFLYFLLAKVEYAVGKKNPAFESMKKAVKLEPRLWPAWEEIVDLIPSKDNIHDIYDLKSPDTNSWMPEMFLVLALRRFNFERNALEKIEHFVAKGFPEVPFILSLKAALFDTLLEHSRAIELFSKLREKDPMRIEEMHLYCDSLFCMSERIALTTLTHSFFKTHKFQWETAYIVGNYYAIRGEHEQAVRFFQRALRLNPKRASIWVIIGHEFVELKNNSAACLAYRKAIEIDPHEYRAWYGLGQLYDILKMNSYALYYYQQAHKCRPVDSRILVALGLIYMKTGKSRDAMKSFTAAHRNGDVEGTALWHLAKLFEKEEQHNQAARTYEEFLMQIDQIGINNDNKPHILRFLARHYTSKEEWDKAKLYAEKCLAHDNIAEIGKTLLRQISERERQMVIPEQAEEIEMEIVEDAEVSYDEE